MGSGVGTSVLVGMGVGSGVGVATIQPCRGLGAVLLGSWTGVGVIVGGALRSGALRQSLSITVIDTVSGESAA